MNLDVLDLLGPIPEELVGKYDIVHVGLIVMVVRNENPTPVLNNLMALLSLSLSLQAPKMLWLISVQSLGATSSGMNQI